jgi:tetratricopeptide (TPR) repeat protein
MRHRGVALIGVVVLLAGCASALKEPPSLEELAGSSRELSPDEIGRHRERAREEFDQRKVPAVREAARLWTEVAQASPDDLDDLILALRARIWLAEHDPKSSSRERESTAAVQTGQWCRRRAPDSPRCAYWLGAALGVQARERRTTALDALPRIEELFEEAAAADPLIDEGGPNRALALLYLRAPAWPAGPGDPDLALEHARTAIDLRPEHPPNQLALGEALLAVEQLDDAFEAYVRALDLAEKSAARGVIDAKRWVRNADEGVNAVNAARVAETRGRERR